VADRLAGENWFLAGDSSGFADPILSAGLTLATTGARKVAYSLTELISGTLDPNWIKNEYDRIQRSSIRQHIRFADYWYSVNAKFTDLKDYCSEIAREAGLTLNADDAFRWLGTGGFTGDAGGFESPSAASFRLGTVKSMVESFGGTPFEWQIQRFKRLRLNLEGASRERSATYYKGRILPQECYRRGQSCLFLHGFYKSAFVALQQYESTNTIIEKMNRSLSKRGAGNERLIRKIVLEVLEAMLLDGWIHGSA
jgi:hypothetical protein